MATAHGISSPEVEGGVPTVASIVGLPPPTGIAMIVAGPDRPGSVVQQTVELLTAIP
jgi:hypothetical protein